PVTVSPIGPPGGPPRPGAPAPPGRPLPPAWPPTPAPGEGWPPRPPPGGVAAALTNVPIGTLVAAVSDCAPSVAPFDCRMNAVTARYWSADSVSPFGGMVLWMNSNRSRVERTRHVLMKLLPASCGASLRPARSGIWQLAQLA